MDGPYVHMMKSKHLILFSICSPSIHLRGYKNTIRKVKMKPFALPAPSTTFHNFAKDFMEAANGSIHLLLSFLFNFNIIWKGIEWNFNRNWKEFEWNLKENWMEIERNLNGNRGHDRQWKLGSGCLSPTWDYILARDP